MPQAGLGVNVTLNDPLAEMGAVWVKTVMFAGLMIRRETVLPAGGAGVTVPEIVPDAFPT
jgi:hypothetical protein